MPRHMSFSMTTEAVRNRTKTVTRRLGWNDLQPGTLLWAVEKGMGLKKGEHVKKLALIRVVSVEVQALEDMLDNYPYGQHYQFDEVVKEGFGELTPGEFIEMFCRANHCDSDTLVNRIEFEYVEGQDA
jgi:hypothetical protein